MTLASFYSQQVFCKLSKVPSARFKIVFLLFVHQRKPKPSLVDYKYMKGE
jgi:hypothetical protein